MWSADVAIVNRVEPETVIVPALLYSAFNWRLPPPGPAMAVIVPLAVFVRVVAATGIDKTALVLMACDVSSIAAEFVKLPFTVNVPPYTRSTEPGCVVMRPLEDDVEVALTVPLLSSAPIWF